MKMKMRTKLNVDGEMSSLILNSVLWIKMKAATCVCDDNQLMGLRLDGVWLVKL